MIILNLGCGTKVSNHPEVVNVDWSIELRLRRNPLFRIMVSHFITGSRRERFNSISDNILVHDLAKGVPFETNSVDVVYHSHLLEHLDRDVAELFLLEIKRVLKPKGIHRIVVPNLEKLCNDYNNHLSIAEHHEEEQLLHDTYIAKIIEQCVRRESYGSSKQKRWLRSFENLILGDARKRGETHQWMYDRISLTTKLKNLGYEGVTLREYNKSAIPGWDKYGLDINHNGAEYKPNSLYVEAFK